MIKHGMEQIQQITSFLSPGQIPMICVIFSGSFILVHNIIFLLSILFSILVSLFEVTHFYVNKRLKLMVGMGPFHIEQAFIKLMGKILSGSG